MVDNKQVETTDQNEDKGESSVVPNQKTLTPVQQIQAQVIKYATALFDKERATEFATRVALIARDNTKLAQAIKSNADSFLSAYMASVSLNLMPNTPEALAYIIPYGDKIQFQTGYKGLIKLARRSGEIKTIDAELVYEGDFFRAVFGTERRIEHEPNFDVDRTDYDKVTHAYATSLLTNGEKVFTVMTRKELDKIQRTVKSSSTDTPWKQWPERMARKTVLKRLANDLPSSAEDLQRAVAYDSLGEAGKLQFKDGEIIEGEIGLSSAMRNRIEAATNIDQLQAILNSLTPKEKALAQPLIDQKMDEVM
jgi:recombination protein RecT